MMSNFSLALEQAIASLPDKPEDSALQSAKKRYSEIVSQRIALIVAAELRRRGLKEARPAGEGDLGDSGAERRIAGGLGAKKVDVTWATEESGLIGAISVKTINFRDQRTKNFQKNLINRRGDMLMEAVTLHRRFPYAVLSGFFFLDKDAELDGTARRRSTFVNAHSRLQLFTGRDDPADREEQFERFYLILLDVTNPASPTRIFAVGNAIDELTFDDVFDDFLRLIARRNPDFYEFRDGLLVKAS